MASRIAVIKGGLLQQTDTPQALYDRPANVSSPASSESPAMNFFNARLSRADGKLLVDTDSFHVEVPPAQRETYDRFVGKQVIFGHPSGGHSRSGLLPARHSRRPHRDDGRCDRTDGQRDHPVLDGGQGRVCRRVDPRTQARPGSKSQVVFNMDNMHLFEVEASRTRFASF